MESIALERNVLITVSILLLVLYGTIKVLFPKAFGINFDFSKLVVFRLREEFGNTLKPFSQGQLLLSGVYALTLGYVLLFLGRNLIQTDSVLTVLFEINGFWMGILKWLLLSFSAFLLIFLKFGFLYLVGWLFNLGGGIYRQFTDFFNSSSVFLLAISFLLSLVLYSQQIDFVTMANLVMPMLVFFLFYRTILIYFKLLQVSGYSKLYIFSYICTTELIPLFIGLKYLIG